MPTLSRVLDMFYTKASIFTTLNLTELVLDVNLPGFQPTIKEAAFDDERIPADKDDDEGLGLMPRMPEQTTDEIKNNFRCLSIEVKMDKGQYVFDRAHNKWFIPIFDEANESFLKIVVSSILDYEDNEIKLAKTKRSRSVTDSD